MADSRAMWFRLVLLIGLLCGATPVAAQTWTACIDPVAGGLTTEGYRAVWAAASTPELNRGRNSFGLTRTSRLANGEQGTNFFPVQLELMRAGVSPILIRFIARPAEDTLVADEECLAITLGDNGVGLWHLPAFYFPTGSAELTDGQDKALAYVLADYRPGTSILFVDGYSDTAASVQESQAISERRTDFIVRALIRLGIRWSDIEARSHGESSLARPTADGVAEGLNRRVTVAVRVRSPESIAGVEP